jgi:preprotein translocase subunit SecE
VAHTDDPHLKPPHLSDPGAPSAPADGGEVDEQDVARQRSLQLGGGVPAGKFLGGYLQFLGDVRDEMGKVTWPTRKQVVTETIVVICVVIVFTLMITSLDHALAAFFNWFLFGKQLGQG